MWVRTMITIGSRSLCGLEQKYRLIMNVYVVYNNNKDI